MPGLESALEKDGPSRTVADDVRTALGQKICGERPAVEKVAKALGMSPRTLQRRLGELGTTYQQLLDDVRHRSARRLLANTDLGVGEVAFLLGFEEINSFTRAFHSWEGTTPREVACGRTRSQRQQQQQENSEPTMTTKQAAIHTGYGATTTAREVIGDRRLDGKVAIVTGGYVGIGLETTRVLAAAGATVIVPARTPERARAALSGTDRVELETVELSDPASVDAFAARFSASGRPLHFLVNNAGIMAIPFAKNGRGFELQFATNHLGHFQLTARLWPALLKAKGARVVALTSRGHAFASVDLEDPSFERRPYDKWKAYGQSKSANALFALALDARGESRGVRAFSVHPGAVTTELARSIPEEEFRTLLAAHPRTFKMPPEGAATSVWCATSPALDGMGGVYCEDVDIGEPVPADSRALHGARPWIMDRDFAARLWTKSEEWTDVRFEG